MVLNEEKEFHSLCEIYVEEERITLIFVQETFSERDSIVDGDTDREFY